MSYLYEYLFGTPDDPEIVPCPRQIKQRHLVMCQIRDTDIKTFLYRTARRKKINKCSNSLAQLVMNKNKNKNNFNILYNKQL